ncbi:hypothetical protein P7K49_016071, partial [Saguinus oedipus]
VPQAPMPCRSRADLHLKNPGLQQALSGSAPFGLGPSRQSREAAWGKTLDVSMSNSVRFSGYKAWDAVR